MRTNCLYGFIVPGMTYAEYIVRANEKEVREYIRWRWNAKRCPVGTQIWKD